MEKKLKQVHIQLQFEEKEKLEIAHSVHIDIDALSLACNIVQSRCFNDALSSTDGGGGDDDTSKVVFFRKEVLKLLEESCVRVRHDLDKNVEEIRLDKLEYLLYRSHVELMEIKKEKDFLSHKWIPFVEAEYESLKGTWDRIIGKWTLPQLQERSKGGALEFYGMEQMRLGLISSLQELDVTGQPGLVFEVAQKLGVLSTELLQMTHENFKQHITVSPLVILEVAGVPTSWLHNNNSWKPPLQGLRERLFKSVVVQKHAVIAITNALSKPNNCSWPRPIGSFLFLCDFAAGGMEIVEALAEQIFDRKDRVIRFDMSDDSVLHSSCNSCCHGIHPRDCNHKEQGGVGGKLVEAVKSQPFCVVLLDNIEEADSYVIGILVDILKHGKLIDLQGDIADFSTTFIMGRDYTFKEETSRFHLQGGQGICEHILILREASKCFKQELFDQLDDIILLDSLRFQDINSVVRLRLRDVPKIMHQKGLILYPSEAALRSIINKSRCMIGAGPRARAWLRENVVPSLFEMLAENEINDMCAIYIDVLVATDEYSYRFKRGGPVDAKDFKQCKESIEKLRVNYRKEKERVNKIYLFRRKYYELKSMIHEETVEDLARVAQVLQEIVSLLDFLILNARGVSFRCEESKLVPLKSLNEEEVSQRKRLKLGDRNEEKALIGAALRDGLGGKYEAIDIIANAVLRSRKEQNRTNQPASSFVFLGLTSVGKADLERLVDEHFATDCGGDMVIPINLQEFSEPDSLVGLIHGTFSHPSCANSFSEAVRVRPCGVFLISEVEKANMSVFNALISVLDHGMLGDSEDKTVDFSNTVVVIMSELGNKEILANLVGAIPGGSSVSEEETKEKPRERRFRTELLNRVNEIVIFNPSAREQLRKVARLSMEAGPHLEEEATMCLLNASFFGLFLDSSNDWVGRSWLFFRKSIISFLSTGLVGDRSQEDLDMFI